MLPISIKSVTRGRLLLLVTIGWVGGIIRGCMLPLNVTMCLGTNVTSYNVQSPPARRYIYSLTKLLHWGGVGCPLCYSYKVLQNGGGGSSLPLSESYMLTCLCYRITSGMK